MLKKWQPVDHEEAKAQVGIGVHTGLRKGCEGGHEAWAAIQELPSDEWDHALSFAVHGLASMGLRLCKEVDEMGPEA